MVIIFEMFVAANIYKRAVFIPQSERVIIKEETSSLQMETS